MKFKLFLGFFFLSFFSCGENFLKLASELGEYSTQQFRDIEEMRKEASECDYEESCFKRRLDIFIRNVCSGEKYLERGFVSTNECERQYPYIFIEIFEQGKYVSVDAITASDNYKKAVERYERERDAIDDAEAYYNEAKREWKEAERRYCGYDYEDEDCQEAEEDWEYAQEDHAEAWEEYREARKDYEQAVKKHKDFF